jgi:serine protease AprX
MRAVLAGVLVAALAAGSAQAEVVDDNPAASSRAAGQVSVFIRGADGSLQQSDLSGGTFTPWRSLGGGLLSGLGAGGRSATVSSVAARGLDGGIYHRAFQSGTWAGWEALGGSSISAPAMDIRRPTGIVDLFWRGVDNGIEAKSWAPGPAGPASTTRRWIPG